MLKVLLFIVICWIGIGAIDFLILFSSQEGRTRAKQLSTSDFLGILIVTIVSGPVLIISSWCRYFRNRKKEN